MSESISKDELVQLLRDGNIEAFNNARPYDEGGFLDLSEIDLNNLKLFGLNLSRVDLSGSDLSRSEIENVDFSCSDLSSVNFSHATITETHFPEVILEGSFLNNACIVSGDFAEVDFSGINACGTDFTGADLSLSKNLMQSVYDAETIWPDNDSLPDDFDPQEEISFAELEETDEFLEEQF